MVQEKWDKEIVKQLCKEIKQSAYDKLYEEGEFDIVSLEMILEDIKNDFRFSWVDSLKDYDKELVVKVLEKAKSLITKYDLLKDYQCCAAYLMLDNIIAQIQKDFEND